jgi:hypothetical protein
MSAFYVGEKHLNWLLGYAQAIGFELSFPARKVGEILSKENDRSLFYRYPDDGSEYTPYRYQKMVIELINETHVQAVKACGCYCYQSCEHPEWEDSWSNQFIHQLMDEARSLCYSVNFDQLYDEAQWQIR